MATNEDRDLEARTLARIRQIKADLQQIETDEREAVAALDRDSADFPAQRAATENIYLKARAELYNEKGQLESDIVHRRVDEAYESGDVLERLAQELDLASTLRASRGVQRAAASCWTNCVECITSCTECVTSCTECVASPGGSCAITSLVSSPCVPKPDIGEQLATRAS